MPLTSRFGLHKYGGGLGGSLTDDGQAFSARDPDIVDAILKAFENHIHDGGARLGDPSEAPSLSLATTGGSLAANTTYYYVVSFIDQFGLETVCSSEVFASTPGTVDKPGAPVVVTETGGTLATGVYYYGLTAISGGNETSLGPVTPVTITDQHTVDITFPVFPTGADHISIWRQGPTETYFSRIDTVDLSSDTYTDTGSIAADPLAYDPSHQPPTTNLTNATSVITVTAPDATTVAADPSLVKAWRIYRTTVSGSYSAQSLLAEVRTTVNMDGTGGLVTTFADNGAVSLTTGTPLSISQTLTPTKAISVAAIADVVADLPPAGQYQDGTLAITSVDDVIWASLAGAWVAVGGGSGGSPSFIRTAFQSYTISTSSGVAVNLFNAPTARDSDGHDLTYVGAVNPGTLGDEIQVNSDGVYSFYVTVGGTGYTAGDMVEIDLAVQNVGSNFPNSAAPSITILLPVRPDGTVSGTAQTPPLHLKAGMRVAFILTPYYASAHGALTVGIGADMLSGKASKIEVYPAPAGVTVTPGASTLDIAWTVSVGDTDYTVLTYDVAAGAVTDFVTAATTSPHSVTGLSAGQYLVYVLGRKTGTDSLEIYSTPSTHLLTLVQPPIPGPYFTNFTGVTDGTLLSAFDAAHWNDANGNPSGTLSITSTHLHNSGTGGPRFALLNVGQADKELKFTHNAAASGSPLVVYLATDNALGNPQVSLGLDGTTTAPVIDHYTLSGTHTAITMTATGAATSYAGSSAAMSVRISGTTVTVYQAGTSVWTATLPSAVAETWAGFGLYNNAHSVDDILFAFIPNGSIVPTDGHASAPDIASALVGSVIFDSTAFTSTEGAPWDSLSANNSGWVKYVCTVSGTVHLDTIGTGADTFLVVTDSAGAVVTFDDNGGGNTESACAFSAVSGHTYYIGMGTQTSGGSATYRLNFVVPG